MNLEDVKKDLDEATELSVIRLERSTEETLHIQPELQLAYLYVTKDPDVADAILDKEP